MLELTKRDKEMLDGQHGRACQIAISILTKMAKIQKANKLIDITHAHIGGSIYTGQGSLKVAEMLADLGAKVAVPTTINAISIDRKRWKDWGVDEEFAHNANRLASAYEKMGAKPIFSCIPYIFPEKPKFGDNIVWAESNAIAFSNSVLGARTNRHGDLLDICAAITGRVPEAGLHLPENRYGNLLFKVPAIENPDSSFYATLGYLIGRHTENGDIPVIEGLLAPTLEDLKAFSSTIATSGAVGLYHIIGVTPEAKTKEQAFNNHNPKREIVITRKNLEHVWKSLSTNTHETIDLIVMGSPHFTLEEFRELNKRITGKKKHSDVGIFITTNNLVYNAAQKEGIISNLENFGAIISTDMCLCMLNEKMLPAHVKSVMTDSGKFAHYGPGLINRDVYFGSMEDCVKSAVLNQAILDKPKWLVS